MAPEHCQIKFYKDASYYGICDLSHKHPKQLDFEGNPIAEDSVMSGTWLSVPANIVSDLEWMNLHDQDNWQHRFAII